MAAGTFKDRSLHIIDTIFQQLLAVFVLLVLWEVFKYASFNNKGTWHIVLCTIGVALCMAEGLLLFNNENTFLKDADRKSRGTIHGVVMLVACLCITIGVSLKISQKNESVLTVKHFSTTHGILGLTTWIFTLISVILGIVAGSIHKFSSMGRPALYKIIHLFFGVDAYIVGAVTLGFGLHYLEYYTTTQGRNVLIVFLALYVAYSLIGSLKTCYNYFFG